jgi:Family of unknown function (DUF5677)
VSDVDEVPAFSLASEILALVGKVEVGGHEGDSAGQVMFGAYLRAYRRFLAITQLAREGAGDEVIVLTRSLLNLVARAMWVDWPIDIHERHERWKRFAKRFAQDQILTAEGLQAAGVVLDEDDEERLVEHRRTVADLADAAGLPPDRNMLESLNLDIFYHRLYRMASDFEHFSFGVAVTEMQTGKAIHFEPSDFTLANEGLLLAIVTYGMFLDFSEKTVKHGIKSSIEALIRGHAVFGDGPGGDPNAVR